MKNIIRHTFSDDELSDLIKNTSEWQIIENVNKYYLSGETSLYFRNSNTLRDDYLSNSLYQERTYELENGTIKTISLKNKGKFYIHESTNFINSYIRWQTGSLREYFSKSKSFANILLLIKAMDKVDPKQ